jgi:hypothetical protein
MDPGKDWCVGKPSGRCTCWCPLISRARRGMGSPPPLDKGSAPALGKPFFSLVFCRGGGAAAGCGALSPRHPCPRWQSVVTAPLSAPPARIPGPFDKSGENIFLVKITRQTRTRPVAQSETLFTTQGSHGPRRNLPMFLRTVLKRRSRPGSSAKNI